MKNLERNIEQYWEIRRHHSIDEDSKINSKQTADIRNIEKRQNHQMSLLDDAPKLVLGCLIQKRTYLWMKEATPSSLNPWISKDTILFGKAKNHLADCKWLKVCGLDVTITWQPCSKNKNILNIFTEKIIKYICKKIPWNHLAIKNQLVNTGQIPKALKQLWLHFSLEHLVYLDVLWMQKKF